MARLADGCQRSFKSCLVAFFIWGGAGAGAGGDIKRQSVGVETGRSMLKVRQEGYLLWVGLEKYKETKF